MKIGILGGMGPFATAELYIRIHRELFKRGLPQPEIMIVSVGEDNERIKRVLSSEDLKEAMRREYLLVLLEKIKFLDKLCDIIVIPCNTVHYLQDYFKEASKKFVSIVDLVKERVMGLKKVGVLGTKVTIKLGIYNKIAEEVIYPSDEEVEELSKVIVRINENKYTEEDINKLKEIAENLKRKGAEKIVLACTELPLVLKGEEFIDTIQVLVDFIVSKLEENSLKSSSLDD